MDDPVVGHFDKAPRVDAGQLGFVEAVADVPKEQADQFLVVGHYAPRVRRGERFIDPGLSCGMLVRRPSTYGTGFVNAACLTATRLNAAVFLFRAG